MSYDVYLVIDTGGPEPAAVVDVGNYTSNVSGMWEDALGYPLKNLHGWQAEDARTDLQQAVHDMETHPEAYRAMNPPNGWGDYEGALDYLRRLGDACRAHPKTTIHISH
ncbi:hypothetical protein [Streptomyces sp. 184]|uniref:hypothetical protein n=1 Tax=Streptomyces sp. 184 TaxID=1827526 RepID=UPI00389140F2